uniref:F-BAR domain-containing protein n=2 Tax=Bursaphelenchus xylophilus TaxID=6326 RepID=A0A1I7SHB5_BURXY
KDKIDQAKEKIEDKAQEVKDKVKDKIEDLKDKVKEKVAPIKDKIDQAKEKIKEKAQEIKDKLTGKGKGDKAKYGLGKSKDDFKNGVKQDVRNKILGITQDPMCHVAVDQAHDCLAKVSLCLQGTYVPLMNRICKQTCCQQIKMYG